MNTYHYRPNIFGLIGALGQGWIIGADLKERRRHNRILEQQSARKGEMEGFKLYEQAAEYKSEGNDDLAKQVLQIAKSYNPRLPNELPNIETAKEQKSRAMIDKYNSTLQVLDKMGIQDPEQRKAIALQTVLKGGNLVPQRMPDGSVAYVNPTAVMGQDWRERTHPAMNIPGVPGGPYNVPPQTAYNIANPVEQTPQYQTTQVPLSVAVTMYPNDPKLQQAAKLYPGNTMVPIVAPKGSLGPGATHVPRQAADKPAPLAPQADLMKLMEQVKPIQEKFKGSKSQELTPELQQFIEYQKQGSGWDIQPRWVPRVEQPYKIDPWGKPSTVYDLFLDVKGRQQRPTATPVQPVAPIQPPQYEESQD